MGDQIDVVRVLRQPAWVDGDRRCLVLVADEGDAGVGRIDHDAHHRRRGRVEVRAFAQVGEEERIDYPLALRRGQGATGVLVVQRHAVAGQLRIERLGLAET